MEVTEAMKFLEKLKSMDANIRAYQEEIENLTTMATSITTHIKEVDVQSSRTRKADDVYVDLIQAKDEMLDVMEKRLKIRHKAIEVIQSMENLEYQTILLRHYLQNYTIEAIAEELHYSERWVLELKMRALEQFQEKMGEVFTKIP